MFADFWMWLLGVVSSTGLIAIFAFFLRDSVAKFFSKSVEHRFEKKLETFKAGLRENEKELDLIRSFLVSTRKDRDAAIQTKRLEAAETLLRARDALSQFSMLVEYMSILNTDELLNSKEDPKRISDFVEALIKPFEIDEKMKLLGAINKAYPRLYLSEKTLKVFDVYENIILTAAMMMKLFCVPVPERGRFIKADGGLSKKIIELVPSSKAGFDTWGESFAYHWSRYFYDETLRALRHEVSGTDDLRRDTQSIEQLALDSRRAQINVLKSLEKAGLPDTLIRPDAGTALMTELNASISGAVSSITTEHELISLNR